MLFHLAGSNSIHKSNDLEPCFRDIRTADQHIAALNSNFEYGGRIILGLPPGALRLLAAVPTASRCFL